MTGKARFLLDSVEESKVEAETLQRSLRKIHNGQETPRQLPWPAQVVCSVLAESTRKRTPAQVLWPAHSASARVDFPKVVQALVNASRVRAACSVAAAVAVSTGVVTVVSRHCRPAQVFFPAHSVVSTLPVSPLR